MRSRRLVGCSLCHTLDSPTMFKECGVYPGCSRVYVEVEGKVDLGAERRRFMAKFKAEAQAEAPKPEAS